MFFITSNRSKASLFVISFSVLKQSVIWQLSLYWWHFGFSDVRSLKTTFLQCKLPQTFILNFKFINSNLLCNKKVPDRERKMCLVLQVSFEKERSSRYGDSVLKEKKLIGINVNVEGQRKLLEIERSSR